MDFLWRGEWLLTSFRVEEPELAPAEAAMEIQTKMEIEEPLTTYEQRRRERDALLRAAGIRPASGTWPRPEFQPARPRFYRVRRLFWPLRGYIRRLL